MKKIKKTVALMLAAFMVIAIAMPSSTVFAESTDEHRIVETPEAVQEVISELRQDESEARVFNFSSQYSARASVIPIATYCDKRFYEESAREFIDLQMECDTLSLTATCSNEDETDLLIFHLEDYTYNGVFNTTIPFKADGSTTTIALHLPEGQYAGYFTGDANIKKSSAYAVFCNNISNLSESFSETASSNVDIPNNIIYISDKKQKLVA